MKSIFMIARSRPSTRHIAWLVAIALLVAQALGIMHATLHGPGPASSGRFVSQLARQDMAGSTKPSAAFVAAEGKSWPASLFASHSSDADCRLYDQASHGGTALHVAGIALPVLLPSFAVAIFQGEALARWAALFDARGPPLTS